MRWTGVAGVRFVRPVPGVLHPKNFVSNLSQQRTFCNVHQYELMTSRRKRDHLLHNRVVNFGEKIKSEQQMASING